MQYQRLFFVTLSLVAAFMVLFNVSNASHVPGYAVRLVITDNATGVDTLYFGFTGSGTTTYCINATDTVEVAQYGVRLAEYEAPPIPPDGVFDARFIDSRTASGACLGVGMFYTNFHQGGLSQTVFQDTFKIKFQGSLAAGGAFPITFSWTLFDSTKVQPSNFMRMKYTGEDAGSMLIDMLANSSETITDPSVSTVSFLFSGMMGTDTISVSPNVLPDFGNVLIETNSPSQPYTVSGNNLPGDIVITAPARFEISVNNSSFTSSITLYQSGGIVPATIIYVRFSPITTGALTGSILHSCTGILTKSVFVSGTGIPVYGPTISISALSLQDFGSVEVGTNSVSRSYTVSGAYLTSNIVITAPAGFQVSTNNSSFFSSITLERSGGAVPDTTIYARFSPTTQGAQSGNITNTSIGATPRNISVSGTGTPQSTLLPGNALIIRDNNTGIDTLYFGFDPNATYCIDPVLGEYEFPPIAPDGIFDARFIDTHTGIGACLGVGIPINYHPGGATPLTVFSDTFKVLFQGSLAAGGAYPFTFSWNHFDSAFVQPASLYMRYTGDDAGTVVVDMLTNSSTTITDVSVTRVTIFFTGTTSENQSSTITISPTSLPDFGYIQVGTTSASQSYLVSGSNLTADIAITAPPGFQVSLNDTTFSGSLTLNHSGGTVPATTIYARFNASSAGAQTGNILHTSAGASTRSVTVSGTGVAMFLFNITVSTGPNGTITPNGSVVVSYGSNQQFTILPDPGYHVDSLIVDNVKVASATSYTFYSVTMNHTIRATFAINTASHFPVLESVVDVPSDQGGKVTLRWLASSMDVDNSVLSFYSIWRAIPQTSARAIPSNSGEVTFDFTGTAYRTTMINGTTIDFEWITNLPAHRLETYSYTAATLYDAMATTNGKHYFFVSAQTDDPDLFYDSNIDSGYSVDNLSPSPVTGLTVLNQDLEPVTLQWRQDENDPDVGNYEVHRSLVNGFTPTPSTIVGYSYDTLYVYNLPTTVLSYYRIVTVDIHGNKSIPSSQLVVMPALDVDHPGSQIPHQFCLKQNYPNPFNPATSIRYALPVQSYVTLGVYTMVGTQVALLVNGEQSAGWHEATFDASALPSGIYVYRIQAGTFSDVKKLTLIR